MGSLIHNVDKKTKPSAKDMIEDIKESLKGMRETESVLMFITFVLIQMSEGAIDFEGLYDVANSQPDSLELIKVLVRIESQSDLKIQRENLLLLIQKMSALWILSQLEVDGPEDEGLKELLSLVSID